MVVPSKIRVLIVDDSLFFQRLLKQIVEQDPGIEVVGSASHPFEARDLIVARRPDVMICDIEMPKMDGIVFIKQLMPQYPIPTIVVSSRKEAVAEALNVGAFDYIEKPSGYDRLAIETFGNQCIGKVRKAYQTRNTSQKLADNTTSPPNYTKKTGLEFDLIAIGASTGGTEAIEIVLKGLPLDMPGIVIVQHIPPVFSKMLAERLNHTTPFIVQEAYEGAVIERGQVWIAPGDQHIKVRKVGPRLQIECLQGERVNGHCPSVDVLFESVAKQVKEKAIGVLLTGMGQDGAKGLLVMKKAGAFTFGQDQATSTVYGMPKAAFEMGAVMKQLALQDLPKALTGKVSR